MSTPWTAWAVIWAQSPCGRITSPSCRCLCLLMPCAPEDCYICFSSVTIPEDGANFSPGNLCAGKGPAGLHPYSLCTAGPVWDKIALGYNAASTGTGAPLLILQMTILCRSQRLARQPSRRSSLEGLPVRKRRSGPRCSGGRRHTPAQTAKQHSACISDGQINGLPARLAAGRGSSSALGNR